MEEKNINDEKYTILVIDDELGPRESLRILFKNKYNVITAENGLKGIDIIKNEKIDLVILDLKMPEKNGIETLIEIRKFNKDVPVIILTGYGDMKTAKKAMEYDVVEFITKPFEISEIENIVAKEIERSQDKK